MATQNTQKKPVQRYENQFEAFRDIPKTGSKQIADALNPLSNLFSENAMTPQEEQLKKAQEVQKKNQKHTPLDLEKLNSSYKNQDETLHAQELARLRNMYHKRIQNDDLQVLQTKHKQEQEKVRREAYEEQMKKQQEQERLAKMNADEPHGKIRKNILGGGKHKADISREVAYENKGQRGK